MLGQRKNSVASEATEKNFQWAWKVTSYLDPYFLDFFYRFTLFGETHKGKNVTKNSSTIK